MKTDRPLSTVIIPTYNRTRQLTGLLDAINSLDPETGPFEVIVVDDGSDPFLGVTPASYNYPLVVIRQKNAGPAAARNRGAHAAGGDHLVFIDDDCIPDSGWLKGFQQAFIQYPQAVLGGKTVNGIPGNRFSQVTHLLQDFLTDHYSPREYLGGFYPSNNLAVGKDVFFELRGFQSCLRFGEDREFCYRTAMQRYDFQHVTSALISHHHFLTLWSFIKLHFQYGGGSYHFRRISAKNQKQKVEYAGPSFYLDLITSPIRTKNIDRPAMLSILLLISQIANLAGILFQQAKTARRKKRFTV
ncbi:MAG: glycosyltransferase [Desulfobacteraceae bacterium]|nr:MAG: glycosyltransferase [Desulfobacteraceae bacterium]